VDTVVVPIVVACITALGVVTGPVLLARVRASRRMSEPSAVYSTAEAFVKAIASDNEQLRQQMSALRIEMAQAKAECDQELEFLHKELDRLRRRM
jgi:outer membrane murein-binding lipoprotein Lpp